MAQRKKRGAARKATLKRGKAPKRAARTRMAKRIAAKTAPKKRVTKTKAKRAVTKKAPIKAPGPPPQQSDAAAETVIVDVIEEPVPGVTVVTEFEATRVQGSEEE
jgi:fructose-1,6-bisphosphatase/inositol monophosphatase family enzyme